MNLGGIFLIGLSVAFVIWLLGKIFQLAMLGWKNALLVGVVIIIGMWAFTRNDSPVAAVPFLDRSVQDVSGQVEGSWTWESFKNAWSGGQVNPYPAPNSISPTQPAATIPTQPVQQGPQQVSRPADVHFSAYTASGFPDGINKDICGYSWGRSGDWWIANQTVLCNANDLPGQTISIDPRSLTGVKVPLPAIPNNVAAIIAAPTPLPTPIPPPTTIPTPTPDPISLAKQCASAWSQWAETVQLHTSEVQYGTGAVPNGLACTLLSGKSLAGSQSEQWFISCPEIGIDNFLINGTLGRSIDSGKTPSGSIFQFTGTGPQCQP